MLRTVVTSAQQPSNADIHDMETRTGPHNADSLELIRQRMQEAMDDLTAAIKTLQKLPADEPGTIRVTGSRGLHGTRRYPGAIPKFEQFAADARKKALLLVREHRRKRRG